MPERKKTGGERELDAPEGAVEGAPLFEEKESTPGEEAEPQAEAGVPPNGNLDELRQLLAEAGGFDQMSPEARLRYYMTLCRRWGLDPYTMPLLFLKTEEGRTILYLNRTGAEQLRRSHRISTQIVDREMRGTVYAVVARATLPDGRYEESIGAVNTQGLKGQELANAFMLAETKAKRRATISLLGLGILDSTEAETLPGVPAVLDLTTGEFQELASGPKKEAEPPAPSPPAPEPQRERPPIRPEAVRELQQALKRLRLRSKEANRLLVSKVVGRELTSALDLTPEEVRRVLEFLSGLPQDPSRALLAAIEGLSLSKEEAAQLLGSVPEEDFPF